MKPADSTRFSAESQSSSRPCRNAPRDVAVLIPAYQPAAALELLITRLIGYGVPAILLVDDGSSAAHQPIFDRLALQPRVHLLRHAGNQGKGTALKTGIQYFLEHLHHYRGLVTADVGGQHSAEDVIRVARALNKSPRLAIMGARNFGIALAPRSIHEAPLRKVLGNRLTAALFRSITGIHLTDVQTGLRALPTALLPELLELPGRRYEFEMSMLLHIARTRHPLAEQPIGMHSHPANTASNFRPITDSVRVLRALFDGRTYAASKPAFMPHLESAANLDVPTPPTPSARSGR